MSAIRITPQPTDAEVAAILAAYEALWPRPAAGGPAVAPVSDWRFSGRWWTAAGATGLGTRPRFGSGSGRGRAGAGLSQGGAGR